MYNDTIIQKYLDLIKANTTDIKGFYNGFVEKIPASMLPAVMIQIQTTEADELSDVEDEHRIKLVLTYIADIRQTLEDSALVSGLNKVIDALVGRNSVYSLKTTSILYILRHNLNIDNTNNLRTDVRGFSVATPGEVATGRFPGLYTAEGTIRFNSHFIQTR